MKRALVSLAMFAAVATPAAAATTVFSDTFNSDAQRLNKISFAGGWTVANGAVDVIGPGRFNFCDDGNCIDLDGSRLNAGQFTKTLNLTENVLYTASFELGGSQRGGSEVVNVRFGTTTASYTLDSADPFGVRTLSFLAPSTGLFSLTFANAGGDNIGAVLDNVIIGIGAPEPSTWAMMLVGFGGLGAMLRRRRARAVLVA